MSDLPAIADMTADAIRREIASILGYRVTVDQSEDGRWFYEVHYPTGSCGGPADNPDRAEAEAWSFVPDWPHDPGAALALCVSLITARRCISITRHNVCWNFGDLTYFGCEEYTLEDRGSLAFALSRLALSALRGDDAR